MSEKELDIEIVREFDRALDELVTHIAVILPGRPYKESLELDKHLTKLGEKLVDMETIMQELHRLYAAYHKKNGSGA